MRVLLANTDEHDWFTCCVNHVKRSSYLLIDSVKFGHNNSINGSRVIILNSIINQSLVEFGQLINSVISNQSFSNEKYSVRLVDMNKFSEGLHQSLVTLHPSSRVNKDDIVLFVFSLLKCFFGDHCRVIFIAFMVHGHF